MRVPSKEERIRQMQERARMMTEQVAQQPDVGGAFIQLLLMLALAQLDMGPGDPNAPRVRALAAQTFEEYKDRVPNAENVQLMAGDLLRAVDIDRQRAGY